jgi:hypothetical protein
VRVAPGRGIAMSDVEDGLDVRGSAQGQDISTELRMDGLFELCILHTYGLAV